MTYPNILVFVDFPTTDVNAARAFYAEVFNWEVEDRITDTFARIVPGGHFKNEDGSPSEIGNLHMGISNAANRSAAPSPISKMNLSPLPSSTKKQAAACAIRCVGMPVPQAMTRISSGDRSSLFGRYTSRARAFTGEMVCRQFSRA